LPLTPLLNVAHEDERYRALADSLASGPASVAASGAIRAYLVAALLDDPDALGGRPVLVVAADDVAGRDLARDLAAYLGRERVRHYPSRGVGYESHLAPAPHLVGLRIAALDSLRSGVPAVVVASAVALAEAIPDASLRPAGFAIGRGEEVDVQDVSELLVESGYERVDQVEERGQFALRGGILDVYGATEEAATRLELFGDEVESIRRFSTFTQRSLGDVERIEIAPAAELDLERRELAAMALEEAREGDDPVDLTEALPLDRFGSFLDALPEDAAVVVAAADDIPAALRDHWEDVTAAVRDEHARSLYVDVSEPLAERATLSIGGVGAEEGPGVFRAQVPTSAARSFGEAEGQLEKEVTSGYRVVVTFEHRGEAERAQYNLNRLRARFLEGTVPAAGALLMSDSPVGEGFVSPELKLAVIPFRRLVHRRPAAAGAPTRGRLASLFDLRVGDYVVHEDHGIARFAGFETRAIADVTRDYLQLEYRGDDRVYAPVEQLAKITRYVGSGGEAPQLSALGSKRWDAIKARARRAAGELAGELLNLYAERQTRRGHTFGPDSEWQLELERSFPYRETPDQMDAIEAVKGDMESDRPMDRLICGDVGYGKTEVALRAAHKAATDGKQVLMLVPTTILAQQHLGTFRERLTDSPVEVGMVSRLRKPAEVRAELKRFEEGSLEILIGTHRLLSRDVRAKDLGLVIVDEEQRFGVKQKELLRQLRLRVDVLSLSATPIPRTLQMSLAGLRDISVIETPPEGRRPVRTYVGPYDEELVAKAIKREVAREGQVFFLHNRIETIHEAAERLRALCPGVSFAEAHGQMDELQLEATMMSFLRGDFGCLVATTIIESGLDIPQANTLIVERSDHLGLAQAYQIRGRVGRSTERAYAYMLYPSEERLSPEASARLATLADHTELGSGFRIAMRDLELRGAGNLLGDEQSGHVAAVGFELYVAMLEEAVEARRSGGEAGGPEEQLRLDLSVDAYLPTEYVPFEAAKIDVHRRVAGAREPGELRALRDELRDRFGPLPDPVASLLELGRLRIELTRAGARVAEVRGGRFAATPVELDSAGVAAIRERIPEAIYETRVKTLALRVEDDPGTRLEQVVELVSALDAALAEPAVTSA
jgi:transcription-repair coupling factor (superfamily II helicase)